MEECIFCQIIKGDLPSKKVLENERVVAFWDIHPQAPFHILVIPKKHISSLVEANEDDKEILGELFLAANKVAKILGFQENGFRVIVNVGADGGMIINHLHLHVLGGKYLGSKLIK